jgi:hypothetical protein
VYFSNDFTLTIPFLLSSSESQTLLELTSALLSSTTISLICTTNQHATQTGPNHHSKFYIRLSCRPTLTFTPSANPLSIISLLPAQETSFTPSSFPGKRSHSRHGREQPTKPTERSINYGTQKVRISCDRFMSKFPLSRFFLSSAHIYSTNIFLIPLIAHCSFLRRLQYIWTILSTKLIRPLEYYFYIFNFQTSSDASTASTFSRRCHSRRSLKHDAEYATRRKQYSIRNIR